MPQTIVNFALPVVSERIDEILASYPFYPYQYAFSTSERRQKLAAYVLSRIPAYYVTMDQAAACSLESPRNCYSAEQHQQIEQLIHQGIEHLLSSVRSWEPYSNHASASNHRPACGSESDSDMTPSSWFG
ncbi:MAG TPA: late competence development ComFB family protein [Trichocoleus sp.]